MGAGSKIEWTEHTFNPWWGCVRVSEGCAGCYAESLSNRYDFKIWGQDADRRYFGTKHWAEPVKWDEAARRLGVMHRVFCGSMCDILEDRDDISMSRYRAFELAQGTPNLLWLFLSKRAENAVRMYPDRWKGNWPRNVMPGFTIENQKRLDERMPHIVKFRREFPGVKIFASCEPLLSALDWTEPQYREGNKSARPGCGMNPNGWLAEFSWLIGGGESGPKARPVHPDWARKLRDDCANRDDMCRPWPLPFLWKQWGEWAPKANFSNFTEWDKAQSHALVMRDGSFMAVPGRDIPDPEFGLTCADLDGNDYAAAVARIGKKAAGRLLDGVEHNGMPRLSYGPQVEGV